MHKIVGASGLFAVSLLFPAAPVSAEHEEAIFHEELDAACGLSLLQSDAQRRLVRVSAVGAVVSDQVLQGLTARSAKDRDRLPGGDVPQKIPGQGASLALLASNQQRVAGRAHSSDEELEAWVDSSLAVTSAMAQGDLASALSSISEASYSKTLHEIIDLASSRYVEKPGNIHAAEFIKGRLTTLGFNVSEQPMDAITSGAGNIVGVLRGADLPDELVLFGCHFDSVNIEDLYGPAPGTDDNGSGVAALLLIAEALAGTLNQTRPRRSVALVAFNAEEEGLFGSTEFVERLPEAGLGTVVAALIADEIAYSGRSQYARKAIFETLGKIPANSAIIDTLAHASQDEAGIAGFEVNYHGFGSDHIPFLNAGIPAALLIERDDEYHSDMWGHSSRDTFDHVDMNFGASMTRVAARTIIMLASPA